MYWNIESVERRRDVDAEPEQFMAKHTIKFAVNQTEVRDKRSIVTHSSEVASIRV